MSRVQHSLLATTARAADLPEVDDLCWSPVATSLRSPGRRGRRFCAILVDPHCASDLHGALWRPVCASGPTPPCHGYARLPRRLSSATTHTSRSPPTVRGAQMYRASSHYCGADFRQPTKTGRPGLRHCQWKTADHKQVCTEMTRGLKARRPGVCLAACTAEPSDNAQLPGGPGTREHSV